MSRLMVVASNGVERPSGSRRSVDLVSEFVDWGAHVRGYRPATLSMYTYTLRRIERYVGRPLETFDENDVLNYLREAAMRYTRSTYRTHRNVLGSFFAWAIEWEHVRNGDPMRRVPRARRPEPEPKPFSAVEVKRIAEAALALGSEHAALVGLGLYAGLRRSEMCGVRWSHLSGDMLVVREGKGGKTRTIPTHLRLQGLLDRHYLVAAAYGWRTWVLQGKFGQRTPNYVGEHLWAGVRKVAGLGVGSNLHRLRHTFAMGVWRGSHDLMALKDALGHESPATVAYYVKADDPALRGAIDSLDWGS